MIPDLQQRGIEAVDRVREVGLGRGGPQPGVDADEQQPHVGAEQVGHQRHRGTTASSARVKRGTARACHPPTSGNRPAPATVPWTCDDLLGVLLAHPAPAVGCGTDDDGDDVARDEGGDQTPTQSPTETPTEGQTVPDGPVELHEGRRGLRSTVGGNGCHREPPPWTTEEPMAGVRRPVRGRRGWAEALQTGGRRLRRTRRRDARSGPWSPSAATRSDRRISRAKSDAGLSITAGRWTRQSSAWCRSPASRWSPSTPPSLKQPASRPRHRRWSSDRQTYLAAAGLR